MAGHSKFKNIMHKKGTQDKKKSKAFTRVVKEIIVAASSGVQDPNFNPRLRTAIITAKQQNLPKEKIDNAIKKATSKNDNIHYEEIRYEGYGPGGVAIIVETLTDNKNRTASEVRTSFTKNGGVLGEQGSVEYLFKKVGFVKYKSSEVDKNQVIEESIELGAEDCLECDFYIEILCSVENYSKIIEALEKKFHKPLESGIKWNPDSIITLDKEKTEKVKKLIDALDNLADVQSISGNYKFTN